MLISMTGYGAGEATSDTLRIQVELKSVNHRYLDVQLRMPREYMMLEPRVVGLVKETYGRGRVELHVKRLELASRIPRVQLNLELAKAYAEQLRSLKQDLGLSGEVDLALLVSMQGVLLPGEEHHDIELEWPLVQEAVTQALHRGLQMRKQEGDALKRDLMLRLEVLQGLHGELVSLSAGTTEQAQEKLRAKVEEALRRLGTGEVDESRLLQEVVYQVDRVDISEELTRFASHLEQLRALLSTQDAVGRKIEFLLQELQRETNTTGAKTSHPGISRCGMLIKVELEKIREQIQNIE
ncbi:MAG: YicC/YloC family endoribonuclease [Myxococcota bacterium]